MPVDPFAPEERAATRARVKAIRDQGKRSLLSLAVDMNARVAEATPLIDTDAYTADEQTALGGWLDVATAIANLAQRIHDGPAADLPTMKAELDACYSGA